MNLSKLVRSCPSRVLPAGLSRQVSRSLLLLGIVLPLLFGGALVRLSRAATQSDPCTLYLHADGGSYETAYSWDFGGVLAPTYGAFAERYIGSFDVCAISLDLTTVTGETGIADLYVWADAAGRPGAVISVATGFDPGPVAPWPEVSRHVGAISASCAGNPVWVGFWGDWPDAANPWLIAADLDGPAGEPKTNIAPGNGFPQGWNDVEAVWGPTQSLGIGVLALPCGTSGACCLPDLSCQILTGPACSGLDGQFLGPNETCSPNPCATVGACCFQFVCAVLGEPACVAGGGEYQGDDSNCDPLPCAPAPSGACCYLTTCVVVEECACVESGGSYVGDGSICSPSPCGGLADIDIVPSSLQFTVVPDATDFATLTISNLGAADLDWSLTEVEVLLLSVDGPASAAGRREAIAGGSEAPSRVAQGRRRPLARRTASSTSTHAGYADGAATSRTSDAQGMSDVAVFDGFDDLASSDQARGGDAPLRGGNLVSMVVDDGSLENSIGLGGGGQFVWFNRFTPSPSDFPFRMTEVEILFPAGSGVEVGELVDIYVYEDSDGDGNPGTGASPLGSVVGAAVQAADDVTWSVYPFPPVVLSGPGDVLIAVVNRTAGVFDLEYPASIDETTPAGRSWISVDTGDPADPPVFPGAALWGQIGDFVTNDGNWLLRGLGEMGGGDCDWLTASPTSGTVGAGGSDDILVTVDATGLIEGSYRCDLVFTSNDPGEPEVTVPVLLDVSTASAVDEGSPSMAPRLMLSPARPNPSSGSTRIGFLLPQPEPVRILVFDAQGRRVSTLADRLFPAGEHTIIWNGEDDDGRVLPSGAYYTRMLVGDDTIERKILRVR